MPSFPEHLALRTPRLRLRPLDDRDAPALFAIFGDPRVMCFWATPAWTSMEQATGPIERSRLSMSDGDALRLGIQRLADGQLIGLCTLFDFAFTAKSENDKYARHIRGSAGIAGQRPDLVIRFGRGPMLPPSLRRPVAAVLA